MSSMFVLTLIDGSCCAWFIYPSLSSKRMLHKDYDHNGSVEKKKSLVMSLKGIGAKTK
jgi:hypothetical protein